MNDAHQTNSFFFPGEESAKKHLRLPDGTDCQIRQMVRNDCRAVHSLLQESFHDAWSLDNLEEMFCGPGYLCMVAADAEGGRIHAFAGMKSVLDEADITDVAVLKRDRGLGLGTFLLRCLLDQAAGNGIRQVFLEVRASNRAALALYKKTGFLPAGRRKNYYRNPEEDALLMKWSRETDSLSGERVLNKVRK